MLATSKKKWLSRRLKNLKALKFGQGGNSGMPDPDLAVILSVFKLHFRTKDFQKRNKPENASQSLTASCCAK